MMSKKQIFDIEKIGFGDEMAQRDERIVVPQEEIKPIPNTSKPKPMSRQKPLPKMPEVSTTSQVRKPVVQSSVYRPASPTISPKQILVSKAKQQESTPSKVDKEKTPTTDTQTRKFKPNVYISPVYGLRKSKNADSFSHEVEPLELEQTSIKSEVIQEKLVNEVNTTMHASDELLQQVKTEVPCDGIEVTVQKSEEPAHELELNESNKRVKTINEEIVRPSENEEVTSSQIKESKSQKRITKLVEVPLLNTVTTEDGALDFDDIFDLLDYETLNEPTVFETIINEFEQEDETPSESEDVCLAVEPKRVDRVEDVIGNDEESGYLAVQPSEVEEEIATYYEMPSIELLDSEEVAEDSLDDWIETMMEIIDKTFEDYGVGAAVTSDYTVGPTVVQIEIELKPGTPINKVLKVNKELALNLAVEELRIEPIVGKSNIGIELPHPKRKVVRLKEILSTREFMLYDSPLYVGLGQDISGHPTYTDILNMPHGLIAGQTGSGKSVAINTILTSILFKASPETVRLMLIDPKRVELTPYNNIPHLLTPVITDDKKASAGLKWVVDEMERRYELFGQNGVRDIKTFNERRLEFEFSYEHLPYILIVIDELADLMMTSSQDVEDSIMRLTQKARAAGIHLIVATQRPTVDVITGLIKANIPTRIAFAVAQATDSRTILDESGAQTLLGKGDMFISENGNSRLKRVQGAYISDAEVERVVAFVKKQAKPNYLIETEALDKRQSYVGTDSDPLLEEVIGFIIETKTVSASSLQRRYSIGYNRAARMVDTLEMRGFITPATGSNRPREVLITQAKYDELKRDETRY